MEDTHSTVLLGQKRAMTLGESLEELITAISHRGGEVRPVLHLKSQDRGGVIAPEALQLQHAPNVSPPSPHTRATSSTGL